MDLLDDASKRIAVALDFSSQFGDALLGSRLL